jgi:hypothetical protein
LSYDYNEIEEELVGLFHLEVDGLKSGGNLSDIEMLISAYKSLQEKKFFEG